MEGAEVRGSWEGKSSYAQGLEVVAEPKEATATVPFLVKVSISDLNICKGPGTNYARTQYIPVGVYTIVEVKSGNASIAGWGRLKSGAGWISLDYTVRI